MELSAVVPTEATFSALSQQRRRRLLLTATVCIAGVAFGLWNAQRAERETRTQWRGSDLVIATQSDAPLLITHLKAVYAIQLPRTSRSVLGIVQLPQPLLCERQAPCVLKQEQWRTFRWRSPQGETLPPPEPGNALFAVYTRAADSYFLNPAEDE